MYIKNVKSIRKCFRKADTQDQLRIYLKAPLYLEMAQKDILRTIFIFHDGIIMV